MKPTKKKAFTMKDVARLAGVSQPTVSYVINGTANISPAVQERVRNAIKEIGYQPNALAQNLKRNSTNTIGLLVPDISNSYYATIAKGVEKHLRQKGYVTFLACTNNEPDVEKLYVNGFIRYNVAGMIIAYSIANSALYDVIKDHDIPLVVLDDRPLDSDIPNVEVCNETGGCLATKHLIDIGCRKIVLASEPLIKAPLSLRINGYRQALEENNIPFTNHNIYIASGNEETFMMGYQIGDVLIHSNIDAIFATSDHLAFGILKRFSESNLDIPGDIALIGYDDVFTSQMMHPSLSTISQPMEEMAVKGAELLLSIIDGTGINLHLSLFPSLVIRDTTKPKIESR